MNRVGVMVVAEVDCGVSITVDLTPSAVESLGLKVDQDVWLIIKTYSCHLLHGRSTEVRENQENEEADHEYLRASSPKEESAREVHSQYPK